MFKSLMYAKRLEEVGFTREQAEVNVQIITDVMESTFATKQDIKDLEINLTGKVSEVRADIRDLETKLNTKVTILENKIMQSEYRQTIKLGTIVSFAIGIAVTLVKLIS